MKVIVLKGKELEKLISPGTLIQELEKVFILHSKGETIMPMRTVMWINDGWWAIMSAFVPGYGVSVKLVNVIPKNIKRNLPTTQALVSLYNPENGTPLAIMDGKVLTAMRTAAICALSVRHLVTSQEGIIGIVGAGFQARYFVKFIPEVFKVKSFKIYDINPSAANSLAKVVQELGYNAIVCDSLKESLRETDIVLEATTSKKTVTHFENLTPPVHVISIGVTGTDVNLVEEKVILQAEMIVVDSRKAVMEEVGDLRPLVERGLLREEEILELGEVIMGKKIKRTESGITVFKSVGLAIQDVCAANLAYRRACEEGIGKSIEI